jgi:hypothetical protein
MKFLRHSLIVLLSLIVFITSSGLTVNLHYCGGHLQNVTMQEQAEGCMMSKPSVKSGCDEKNQKTQLKKVDTCCQNHQIKAKSDTKITDTKAKDVQTLSGTFVAIQSYFTSLFSFNSQDNESDDQETDYSLFPVLKEGLYILLQQFRN